MRGFFDSLTASQKKAALEYRGEETHGVYMPSDLFIRFKEQRGKCFYCGFDAWMPGEGINRAARRLGLPISGAGWRKGVQRRMATREHLQRRADGGPDALANYVMAHRWCNKVRGERTVEDHKATIFEMIEAGKCKTSPWWSPVPNG